MYVRMTNEAVGLIPILVYVGAVVLSIPASLVTYGVGRYLGSTRVALRYVGAGIAGLVLAGGVALAVFVGPVVGVVLVAVGVAAALVLAAFPLFIGRQLLERWTPLGPDGAAEYAVLGLPVGLVTSFAVFLAPGGPAGYDFGFPDSPIAAIGWTIMGLAVTFGPAVAGLGMYRLVDRLDRTEKTY